MSLTRLFVMCCVAGSFLAIQAIQAEATVSTTREAIEVAKEVCAKNPHPLPLAGWAAQMIDDLSGFSLQQKGKGWFVYGKSQKPDLPVIMAVTVPAEGKPSDCTPVVH